jgi:23S rRNA pseudouridine2604 synthase
MIDKGLVTVNGVKASNGVQVGENDIVCVNGKNVKPTSSKVVLAFNKPVGVTCTERDKHAKTTIVDAVKYPIRLTYAGRLDKDSDGLIIMTNDGDLINQMMKGANRHEKEYIVKTDKEITDDFVGKMSEGVYIKELDETTRPCTLEKIGKYTFKIILTQGLNRQIRRMCECQGYKVKSLTRVRVMNIELGNLKSGEYREIKGEELATLYRLCGMKFGGL